MQKRNFLFAVSGVKNSGKTTLITKLIPILTGHGLRVATIKHDGHDFAADVPGTDSYAHMCAGACGTAVFSASKYMVVKRQEQISERQLAEFFPEADILLLEGFKNSSYPRIELVRQANSRAPVCGGENLTAIASDFLEETEDIGVPVLDLNDPEAIAEFILDQWLIRTKLSMIILAGGLSSRMGQDKADLCYKGKTLLERQIDKGKQLGISDILVSGYRGESCTEQIVADRYRERGPMGGLEAALLEAGKKSEYALVMSVDTPRISLDVLRALIRAFRRDQRPAVVLMHRGWIEPLTGIYECRLAGQIETALLEGKSSVLSFLRQSGYGTYETDAPEWMFQNINDPNQWKKLTDGSDNEI